MRTLLGLVLLAAASPPSPAPDAVDSPAGVNFTLPLFSVDGFRTLLLRGSSARPVGNSRIDVSDMNLTLFAGDAANTVDTVILAPEASFETETRVASGSQGVRLVRDDLEVSGDRWTYDQPEKRVLIENNVKLIFHFELSDLLK